MNAKPTLELLARLFAKHRLDVVLIGNAAAALQGSPITTADFDFIFRKTPGNLRRLRRLADDLGAVVLIPFYPASGLYRVVRERDGLQLCASGAVPADRRSEAQNPSVCVYFTTNARRRISGGRGAGNSSRSVFRVSL